MWYVNVYLCDLGLSPAVCVKVYLYNLGLSKAVCGM